MHFNIIFDLKVCYKMDKHLNCFYSYNNDEELIENNLTRSFIVTLTGISDVTRNKLLSSLNPTFQAYNFTQAEFALQNNIPLNPVHFKNKYIMTIATDTIIQNMDDYLDIDKETIKNTLINQSPPPGSDSLLNDICGRAIPDAWIYDPINYNCCFLIECKTQGDYLYYPQIVRHAYQHYRLMDLEEINLCTIKLTWDDILESIGLIDHFMNDQEKFLIDNFIQFLTYFGFSLFRGFSFKSIPEQPILDISIKEYIQMFNFEGLGEPADFRLTEKEDDSLFNFENIPLLVESYFKKGG